MKSVLSDNDLLHFYQEPLCELTWDDGNPYMLMVVPYQSYSVDWHEKAFAATVRLVVSGLAICGSDAESCLEALAKAPALDRTWKNDPPFMMNEWIASFLESTTKGEAFIKQFNIDIRQIKKPLASGFREASGRLFDEHGVGFDTELPYKMQF